IRPDWIEIRAVADALVVVAEVGGEGPSDEAARRNRRDPEIAREGRPAVERSGGVDVEPEHAGPVSIVVPDGRAGAGAVDRPQRQQLVAAGQVVVDPDGRRPGGAGV